METLIVLAFLWFTGASPVSYSVSSNADPVVGVAVDMMQDDLESVTDLRPRASKASSATIRIIQYDKEKANLRRLGVPSAIADSLRTTAEAFYVGTHGRQIIVAGSDARGTAYGVLEISRLAGVSPWIWWGDSKPEKRQSLSLPEGYSTFQHPSVEFRGIFLNDEDWGFRPWSTMTYSPRSNKLTISADTYRQIFKLLLRLRGNALWPGMHPGTTAFFKVPGAREAADSCGILIGTSHCEPLLRNNVDEWDVSTRGRYNYITNKSAVKDYWIERLKEVKGQEAMYTIGMRGIHDGSMEGVKTLDEKTAALQQVIDDQRELLKEYVDKNVTKVPQMFMPYKEVLQIMENGLKVPDDVTIVWCDDNYGYMTRLSDDEQQKRSGGGGVYYHLSYCGRPHDYLWLTTTQPGLIYNEMRQAYDHNVRRLWIANVNDPKKAGYDLEFFLDMAWDIEAVQAETINDHLAAWLKREYGEEAGGKLAAPMTEFYRLCAIRKPEFMGWSQVELPDKKLYPLGLSQVKDSEFSFGEFGNEAQSFIDDFRVVRRQVEAVAQTIESRSQDSYFANILYPVCASESMVEKMLYAQLARQRALTTYSPMDRNVETDTTLMAAAALSQHAYRDIRTLTAHFNNDLASGKWARMMSSSPRDLYVFWAPRLPVQLGDAEVEYWRSFGKNWKAGDFPKDEYYSCDARNYTRASVKVRPVENLGHSANAVPVPKGGSLHYSFELARGGDAMIRVAVIPTQANDRGDIRFSIAIDGEKPEVFSIKEPYRSESWKVNVLRGQAVVEMPVNIKAGRHEIHLAAIDDHIIFDQWIIDLKKDRGDWYVFPR